MYHNPGQQHSDEGWDGWRDMVREFSCSAIIQPSEITDSELQDWLRYLAEQGERPSVIPDTASQRQGTGCFLATAVYGSPFSPEVRRLRAFRDDVLQPHPIGRILTRWYYTVGPRCAEWVAPRPWARTIIRRLLDRAVCRLPSPTHTGTKAQSPDLHGCQTPSCPSLEPQPGTD